MELKGKVTLVTGAARRVGRTIATHFAERGAIVAVHYNRSRAEAEAVVAEIERAGGRARAFGANLESVAEIERMVKRSAERVRPYRRADQLRLGLLSQAAGGTHRARLGRQPRHESQGAVFSFQVCCGIDAPARCGQNRQHRRLGRHSSLQQLSAVHGLQERTHRADARAGQGAGARRSRSTASRWVP